MEKRKNSRGFTLIEVLAVVVILGIIAGIAIPSVFRYVKKSRNSAYQVMQTTIYDGARNYVLDENKYLISCEEGFDDIESEERLLEKLQYVEKLIDPADNSKQCFYKVYGCMESEASMDSLATYKYKVQIDCVDYRNCAVYRDDGTILPCDTTTEQTEGPICGTYTASNTNWKNIASVDVSLTCEDNTTGKCDQRQYNQTFTSEAKSGNIVIKDIFGNKTTCPVNVYIDRSAPSKPVIENAYNNKWTNKSYSIKIKSVDGISGIKYFEYHYPNSSNATEREWKQWASSSKRPGDNTAFTTTNFSLERNENVEVRACDYAGNCSDTTQSMIKIDKSKPTCTIFKNPASPNGADGWYTANVSLSFSTNDTGGSEVREYDLTTSSSPSFGGKSTAVQGNTTGITYYGHVKDNAGNIGKCNSGSFKVDTVPPSKPVITNTYENIWINKSYSIKIKSVDNFSGIKYFEYRYPNSSNIAEREWKQWVSSSKPAGDNSDFTTTNFSLERNENVEVRACDYVGFCSEATQSSIKIDKTGPAIENEKAVLEGTNRYITANLSDWQSNVIGYHVVTDTATPSTFIAVASTPTYSLKASIPLTAATYYIWVKDGAGNTFKKQLDAPSVQYTVKYNMNGGSGSIADQIKIYGRNLTLSSTKPTRSQYTFLGWSASSTATTATYLPGATYSNNENITLYAVWKKAVLQVSSYSCANGSVGSNYGFTYTGNCQVINDGGANWRVKFLTSGTFIPYNESKIDVFLVGGGAGGQTYELYYQNSNGGGGGYTKTVKHVNINAGTSYYITVGAGGSSGGHTGHSSWSPSNGGASSGFGYAAGGGSVGSNYGAGSGGSGGGGGAGQHSGVTGVGGSDGGSGGGGLMSGGGAGQGSTTREFGEATGALYSGGGAGGGYDNVPRAGGAGGGGANSSSGIANTGGGGGGSFWSGGSGGSGIVIIRNAR